MKNWRKCALLCLLAVLILTVGAAACEGGERRIGLSVFEVPEIEISDEGVDAGAALLEVPDYEGAMEALLKGIWNGDASIDISAYGIPFSQGELVKIGNGIKYSPEAFSVMSIKRATGSGGVFKAIEPAYSLTGDSYANAKAVYTDGLNEIVEQVDPDWSDLEKVLFIHDYLAAQFEYDLSYSVYDAYRFFLYGVGVCEAYTKTFIAVAREVGLNVSYVESSFLNHAWNLVKLDGKWYHLDVTHDDPLTDRVGYARHLYFLQSDAAAVAQRRSVWTPSVAGQVWIVDWVYGNGQACTDTTYDEYFWRDAVSPFVEAEGTWYAVTEDSLKTWDGASDGFGETLDNFVTPSAGLALHCGKLYYNDYYNIRCYELFTERVQIVANFGSRYGEGLRIEGDTLTYQCFWEEGNTFKHGRGTLELLPWFAGGDGSFGYYVTEGTLYLADSDVCVAVVCYDEWGSMTACRLLTGKTSCTLQKGQVKLIAMTANGWLPCGEAVSGTVH